MSTTSLPTWWFLYIVASAVILVPKPAENNVQAYPATGWVQQLKVLTRKASWLRGMQHSLSSTRHIQTYMRVDHALTANNSIHVLGNLQNYQGFFAPMVVVQTLTCMQYLIHTIYTCKKYIGMYATSTGESGHLVGSQKMLIHVIMNES